MARIISCEEQGPVDIPLKDVLDESGRLQLNKEIESGDFFSVSLKRGVISLRARGFVGYIPLTSEIVVHVRPRVPVSNLSRVIRISGEPPTVLSTERGYETTAEWDDSLLDIYARALARHVEVIVSSGLLREYVRREEDSSYPRGRVLLHGTLGLRARSVHHKAHVAWFERSVENAPNRTLKYAIWLLAQRYIAAPPTERKSRLAHRHLNALYSVFDGVALDHSRRFLDDGQVTGSRQLPALRAYYRDALNVAVAVIRQEAVLIDRPSGPVRLPSVVLNMNYVFEAYVRNTLRAFAEAGGLPIAVLDGNVEGRRGLYDGKGEPLATPDVVVRATDQSVPPLVLEVKNVPVRKDYSEREYVNQVVTYALTYRAKRVVLVHPRASAFQQGGLSHLGDIDQVSVYQYRFDLGADDLSAEDAKFGETITGLLAPVPAPS